MVSPSGVRPLIDVHGTQWRDPEEPKLRGYGTVPLRGIGAGKGKRRRAIRHYRVLKGAADDRVGIPRELH